jgi:hypothetical protein
VLKLRNKHQAATTCTEQPLTLTPRCPTWGAARCAYCQSSHSPWACCRRLCHTAAAAAATPEQCGSRTHLCTHGPAAQHSTAQHGTAQPDHAVPMFSQHIKLFPSGNSSAISELACSIVNTKRTGTGVQGDRCCRGSDMYVGNTGTHRPPSVETTVMAYMIKVCSLVEPSSSVRTTGVHT